MELRRSTRPSQAGLYALVFSFLMLYKLQTSFTILERKFFPRSDSRDRGAPCLGIISSVIRRVIVTASMFLTGNISGHLVRYSTKTTIYRLPVQVTGRGPRISTAMWSKAADTGIGKSGARLLFRGFLRVAQSLHDRIQCSTSLYIPRQ